MAREKLKVQDYPDYVDTLPADVEPVYDVEVDELTHAELQILATEVGKEQKAAKEEASVDLKIKEIESKIATEKAWDKKVSEVESKVTRIVPKPKNYEHRVADVRKLDEAQLKVYETQLSDANKAEVAETKKIENKSSKAETK